VELELAEVVREHEQALGRHAAHRGRNERDVIALDVELATHALRPRHRRRIEKDELVTLARGRLEPGDDVFLEQPVLAWIAKAVRLEIALRPVEIRRREIDGRRRLRPAGRRIDARRAGVREEIQKMLARGELAQLCAYRTVVQE